MYEKHFGLRETPFSIAPNPRFLYMSERHREALAHLVYGIGTNGGFVLLTGEVGTGKTTISRCLLEQVPENTNIAVILNPKVVAHELLATICDELHIQYPEGYNSIKTFVDRIYRYLLQANAAGRKTVVIIEESQNLTSDVLEQLRMLTNLETDQHKLMQIIMIGQPELLELLALPELRQLEQRITARYHLQPLTVAETADYVNHRLKVAGARAPIFSAAALKRVHRLSGGVPRRINLLCDRAMLGAYVKHTREIDNSMLNKAAEEVFGNKKPPASSGVGAYKPWMGWTALAASLVIGGIGLSAAYYKKFDSLAQVASISQAPTEQASVEQSASEQPTVQGQIITGTLEGTQQPSVSSKQAAYSALFAVWNAKYDTSMGEDYCDIAHTFGLKCLEKKGNLKKLKAINRPAVLELKTLGGEPYYITLVKLQDDAVEAFIGGRRENIPVRELITLWHGKYTLFWRAPPSYHGPIIPGSNGPDVLWLSNQVSLIVGRELSKDEKLRYGPSLVEDVKTFQAARGLAADGIVGSMTLIHLNSEVFEDTPLLVHKNGG